MKKKLTFIINPISGGIAKQNFPNLIERIIDPTLFDITVNFTDSADHNLTLAQKAIEDKQDIIVAVGGDGTINNVAKFMAHSDALFGIIPQGSGNGLARHLKIPMDSAKALELINKQKFLEMDAGMANDQFFINVAGAGFDAHVSWMFATAPKRGFWSYTKITLREFAKYKPEAFELFIDGVQVSKEAFILCIANGSQYGNNAFIAPGAHVADGRFDISIMKPFKVFQMPIIGSQMFLKQFNNSSYVDTFSGEKITLKRQSSGVMNIDGEPVMMDKDINLVLLPKAIKIIVP